MTRSAYIVPYFIWIVITVMLVEKSLINDRYHLFTFILVCSITALILEVIRNRWLNYETQIIKTRLILFIILNLLLGIPLIIIVLIIYLPVLDPLLGRTNELDRVQQYIEIGYVFLWFVINAILVRPRDFKGIMFFFLSIVMIWISTVFLGLAIILFS